MLPETLKKKVFKFYSKGRNEDWIARKYGITKETVLNILNNNEVVSVEEEIENLKNESDFTIFGEIEDQIIINFYINEGYTVEAIADAAGYDVDKVESVIKLYEMRNNLVSSIPEYHEETSVQPVIVKEENNNIDNIEDSDINYKQLTFNSIYSIDSINNPILNKIEEEVEEELVVEEPTEELVEETIEEPVAEVEETTNQIKCHNCGTITENNDAKFCYICGAELKSEKKYLIEKIENMISNITELGGTKPSDTKNAELVRNILLEVNNYIKDYC